MLFQSCYKECELLCRGWTCIYVVARLPSGCRWQRASHGAAICYRRCQAHYAWCKHVTRTS